MLSHRFVCCSSWFSQQSAHARCTSSKNYARAQTEVTRQMLLRGQFNNGLISFHNSSSMVVASILKLPLFRCSR